MQSSTNIPFDLCDSGKTICIFRIAHDQIFDSLDSDIFRCSATCAAFLFNFQLSRTGPLAQSSAILVRSTKGGKLNAMLYSSCPLRLGQSKQESVLFSFSAYRCKTKRMCSSNIIRTGLIKCWAASRVTSCPGPRPYSSLACACMSSECEMIYKQHCPNRMERERQYRWTDSSVLFYFTTKCLSMRVALRVQLATFKSAFAPCLSSPFIQPSKFPQQDIECWAFFPTSGLCRFVGRVYGRIGEKRRIRHEFLIGVGWIGGYHFIDMHLLLFIGPDGRRIERNRHYFL